jgi:hypothetical protein
MGSPLWSYERRSYRFFCGSGVGPVCCWSDEAEAERNPLDDLARFFGEVLQSNPHREDSPYLHKQCRLERHSCGQDQTVFILMVVSSRNLIACPEGEAYAIMEFDSAYD